MELKVRTMAMLGDEGAGRHSGGLTAVVRCQGGVPTVGFGWTRIRVYVGLCEMRPSQQWLDCRFVGGTAVMLVSPTDGTDEIANPFAQPDGA
ncbi:hypothetical protein MRB53_001967 [Persea americana]|uniref:Uncharacterized protein n=1 Tax=Persea americana TaxID=3435 RepID=A0ACC2MUT7_PERAE|nr:hypothetical protein MRB53_001967 [Persea americana]